MITTVEVLKSAVVITAGGKQYLEPNTQKAADALIAAGYNKEEVKKVLSGSLLDYLKKKY